jgi:hypothetical protein
MDEPQHTTEGRDPTLSDDALYARGSCTALVITCSDFRFKSVERAFAEAAALSDDYDLIARPGAIRSLVAPRSSAARETLEEEIALLWRVHGFARVLMVNHMSCRAYDDLVADTDERALHAAHLRQAGPAIERLCAGVVAEGYVVGLADGVLRVERI